MPDLPEVLNGRKPLVIAIQDTPAAGEQSILLQLGLPISATVELHGYGPLNCEAILLSRSEALGLATRLTEIMGPLDTD